MGCFFSKLIWLVVEPYPSEQYESQLGMILFHIKQIKHYYFHLIRKSKTCSSHHQPVISYSEVPYLCMAMRPLWDNDQPNVRGTISGVSSKILARATSAGTRHTNKRMPNKCRDLERLWKKCKTIYHPTSWVVSHKFLWGTVLRTIPSKFRLLRFMMIYDDI